MMHKVCVLSVHTPVLTGLCNCMLQVAPHVHGQHDDSTCCSLHFAEALQHSVLNILLQCCSNFEALIVTTFPLQLAAGYPMPWPSIALQSHGRSARVRWLHKLQQQL